MEKEKVKVLLSKLAKHGIGRRYIDALLRRSEDIIIELLSLKDELFIKGIKVINTYDDTLEALEGKDNENELSILLTDELKKLL